MKTAIPDTPQALRRLVLPRLLVAGVVISLFAGGISCYLESRHVEDSAFELATTSAKHFDSPDMRAILIRDPGKEHLDLNRLLNESHFVGIRIFDSAGNLLNEAWKSVPATLITGTRAHKHEFPKPGEHHHNWITDGEEDFIQVVLPLGDTPNKPDAYFEGIYRIEAGLRKEHERQIRSSGLIALISAFVASLLLYPLLVALTRRAWLLSRSLLQSNTELIQTLGSAIAKRDSDTDAHNYRVTLYAVRLAESMQRPRGEIADLIAGAFLHDVGKIGIPDQILLKPGRLTAEEFEVMKQHVRLGQDIVANNRWLTKARTVICHHHERFDGSGYLEGLAGETIPLNARLFALVDVFDALTSVRPYKKALPLAEAIREVEKGIGKHFDPEISRVFLSQAESLYAEICCATPDKLRARLTEVVSDYFGKMETA